MKFNPIWKGIALCCLLCPTALFAQSAKKLKNEQQTRITTCTPEGLAGLIKYDHLEAAEKLGLKPNTSVYEKFDRMLSEHDRQVDAIVQDHQALFEGLYKIKAEYEDRATAQQDFQPLVELIRLMGEQLEPISGEVDKENEYLNVLAAHVLGEKMYPKWERYQRKVHKKCGPRYPRPMAGPLDMD